MDVALWVQMWANEDDQYLKYDHNMWPYELPEHHPAEIYFAGALLLDTAKLLFSRPTMPPPHRCLDHYPYGTSIALKE